MLIDRDVNHSFNLYNNAPDLIIQSDGFPEFKILSTKYNLILYLFHYYFFT